VPVTDTVQVGLAVLVILKTRDFVKDTVMVEVKLTETVRLPESVGELDAL